MDIFFSWIDTFFGPDATVQEVMSPAWPVLIVGFIAGLIATPIARKVAFKIGVLDMPNSTVKTHKKPTAYLGGVAVLVAFLVAFVAGVMMSLESPISTVQFKIVLAVCFGAFFSCFVGLVDDIKDISPWQKLLGQAICSIFLVWGGLKPDLHIITDALGITLPGGLESVLGFFIVLFFVLGASNSLNLLDGLDGLCTGVTAIISVGFLLLEIHLATWETDPEFDAIRIIVATALVGAALGFLVYNRHPAKIFLGDAGSILLGFIIASMMILFSHVNPRWWLASILIFGLPILDTGTALIRRALNKRPLFVSDRGHIYDQMIDRGISLKNTVALNYLLATVYVVLGLFSAVCLRMRYAIIFDVIIFGLSFAIVGFKGYFQMTGCRGSVQKKHCEDEKDD